MLWIYVSLLKFKDMNNCEKYLQIFLIWHSVTKEVTVLIYHFKQYFCVKIYFNYLNLTQYHGIAFLMCKYK